MPQLSDIVVGSLCFTVGAAGLYYFAKRIRNGMRNADAILTSDLDHTMSVESFSLDPSLQSAADGFSVEESLEYHQLRNEELKRSVSYLTSTSVVLQKELSLARTVGLNLIEEQEHRQVALAEAERTNADALESITRLEMDNSALLSQVDTLRDSERDAKSRLSEMTSKCVEITTDSLAEAKQKYEQALKTNTRMERKVSHLKKKVNVLQEELSVTQTTCKDLSREQEQQQIIWAKAEKKFKKVMASNAQLKKEKTDLMSQIQALRESEREANSSPSETKSKSNLAETTTESLADGEKENQVLLTTIEKLQKENSDLHQLVATLQDSLREQEEELSETKGTCYELTWDLESEIQAHDNLKSEFSQMKEEHAELLKQRKTQQEPLKSAMGNTEVQQNDFHQEIESLKDSLAALEKENQALLTTNKELTNENSDLSASMRTLQDSFCELEGELSETKTSHDELTRDCQTAQDILKSMVDNEEEQKNIFNQRIELLEESLADFEKEIQVLLTTNKDLQIKNSEQNQLVATLQDSLREQEEELSETKGTCYELTWDLESEIQAHDNLKSEFSQMKEEHAELLKEREREQALLDEAERKCKEAMDSVAQLEIGNSDLMSQMEMLQGSVQLLKEELSEAWMMHDEAMGSEMVVASSSSF